MGSRELCHVHEDLNVFMLKTTLSMNFSAKHKSHCPSKFYKVALLRSLSRFPMSTICLLFLMERVKAQGGGPNSRC